MEVAPLTSRLRAVARIIAVSTRYPTQEIEAELTGIITRINNKGAIIFITLNDGTGAIQLVIQKNDVHMDAWELARRIKVYDRVKARGMVATTASGRLSVFLTEPPAILDASEFSVSDEELSQVGSSIILALLRKGFAEALEHHHFVAMETRTLASGWNDPSSELQIIEATFAGFGLSVPLLPSPLPELLPMVLALGKPRAYTIGRVFTASHRDPITSHESLTATAVVTGVSTLEELTTLGERVLREGLALIPLQLEHSKILNQPSVIGPSTIPPGWSPDDLSVQVLEAQHIPHSRLGSSHGTVEPFRLWWPMHPATETVVHRNATAVVEGFLERAVDSSFPLGVLSFNLERCAALVSQSEMRRLLRLQPDDSRNRRAR